MRVMLWTAESTCNWLAWISSGDWAPLLAAWTTRLLMFSSRLATSLSAPSAVLMTLLARLELSIAWWMPVISLRRASLAMSPAGSSTPRLIRRPLLSRWSVPFSVCWDLASPRWAVRAETFVLMRAIQSSVIAHGEPGAAGLQPCRAVTPPGVGGPVRGPGVILDLGLRILDWGRRRVVPGPPWGSAIQNPQSRIENPTTVS